mgnify:CR=1 FL=1
MNCNYESINSYLEYTDSVVVSPDITINEMIIRHAKRMLKRNPDLREEEATGILCNFLPNLKRWNPNPDDEIDEEEEPVMGYRGNARDMF